MLNGGFNRQSLNRVSESSYVFPEILLGDEHAQFYDQNPEAIRRLGLSLFIFSKEKGWGKTTLAHRLVYRSAVHFMETSRYSRDLSFRFERAYDLANSEDSLWKATYYVLDDLGGEDRSAKWFKEAFFAKLGKVLNYRRDNGLTTIVTSNYTPKGISELYEGLMDSLLEVRTDIIKGKVFRGVEVGGGIDFRATDEETLWPV